MKTHARLLSLDVMRGITIAGMIMVNNPGNWSSVYAPLRHAAWDGLTPTDLVFPFFMFIMGVSMDFSLQKYNNRLNLASLKKILIRTVVIFSIGLGIAWFSGICNSIFNIGNSDQNIWQRLVDSMFPIHTIRILGVMQRLALCYCGGAILSLIIQRKYFLWTAVLILIAYAVILLKGNGFVLEENNIIAVVDRAVLGVNHMYRLSVPGTDMRIPFDPEGLLSTLPCIPHVMFGMYAGRIILEEKNNLNRISRIFIFGTVLLFSGCLLSYGIPVNKLIWSPTYVLITCGLASLFLSLLIWIIDMKNKKKWCRFFESFGINPLFMYVWAALVSILLGNIRFVNDGKIISLKGFIYNELLLPWLSGYQASLVYALMFVGFIWLFGYQLYKRHIYIKI
ncbi:MAG: acyltransferase family protein [Bacteroidales bacterium]